MKRRWIVAACALAMGAAGLLACGDDTLGAGPEGGAPDASLGMDAEGFETGSFDGPPVFDAPVEAGPGVDAGPDVVAAPPSRLLLSYNATTSSELAAFGLGSKAVDGVYVYPGFIGTTTLTASNPWLLEQANDLVSRMDPISPWVVQSSWNVAGSDLTDAGFAEPYSDPDAVILGPGSQAYVLRYTRNNVAVINTSQDIDAGTPMSWIDLSSQVQAAGDGYVEMTAGYSVQNLIYVLLGNINRNVSCEGAACQQMCTDTNPTIVAIDPTSNTLVPPGSTDGGTAFVLQGYDPPIGPSTMVYDAPNKRFLVLETGCYPAEGDAGLSTTLTRAEVEAVSLVDGSTQKLLDLSTQPFPLAMYYIDQHAVILQLYATPTTATSYMWDPSSTTLGAVIPNAPDTYSIDGTGNLVGLTASDAGAWSVVSVNPTDGGSTPYGPVSFTPPDAGDAAAMWASGFVSGAQLWPAP
jgi:hypothetical protein